MVKFTPLVNEPLRPTMVALPGSSSLYVATRLEALVELTIP